MRSLLVGFQQLSCSQHRKVSDFMFQQKHSAPKLKNQTLQKSIQTKTNEINKALNYGGESDISYYLSSKDLKVTTM